jgi:integrase
MPRPRNPIPPYRLHAASGRAVVDVYRTDGKRTTLSLPGAFDSDESKAEYERIIGLIRENKGRLPLVTPRAPGELTIAELAVRFLNEKVDVDYVTADGRPTTEKNCYERAIAPLTRLCGMTLVREFDAAALDIVRQAMVDGSWMNEKERKSHQAKGHGIGWSRRNVNKQVSRLRSMFKWGIVKKIVPTSVVTDIKCLTALKAGRGGARESEPIDPVPIEDVDATIPHLPPVVADMVRLQLLTGCRPGELCAMRGELLDRSGPIWILDPKKHKTAHHGHKREIAIGPKAQLILRRYLKDDPAAFLFSPAEQLAIINATKRAARKTKVQPSQVDRRDPRAKRKPRDRFSVTAYNRAITRAAAAAGVKHWHAHQLRHTASRLVSREHGAEAARAVLGHRTIAMTAHYAGVDLEKAAEVARKMG